MTAVEQDDETSTCTTKPFPSTTITGHHHNRFTNCCDRVGEFAIGTNTAVHNVIGNILQDEKIPGIHIAFGNPYGAHTGADWYSATHIDVVGLNFDIWIDGRQIMRGGAFLLDSLPSPAL